MSYLLTSVRFLPTFPPPLPLSHGHPIGAAGQLTQPDRRQVWSAGAGRLPGLPGLGDAQRQRAAAAEQALALRRGGGPHGAQAGLRALPRRLPQAALPPRRHLHELAIWW